MKESGGEREGAESMDKCKIFKFFLSLESAMKISASDFYHCIVFPWNYGSVTNTIEQMNETKRAPKSSNVFFLVKC